MEISAADFLQPITIATRSQFLTTRAAARHMTARGSGVILAFGGGGPPTLPGLDRLITEHWFTVGIDLRSLVTG
jgi:hypothetical protein